MANATYHQEQNEAEIRNIQADLAEFEDRLRSKANEQEDLK